MKHRSARNLRRKKVSTHARKHSHRRRIHHFAIAGLVLFIVTVGLVVYVQSQDNVWSQTSVYPTPGLCDPCTLTTKGCDAGKAKLCKPDASGWSSCFQPCHFTELNVQRDCPTNPDKFQTCVNFSPASNILNQCQTYRRWSTCELKPVSQEPCEAGFSCYYNNDAHCSTLFGSQWTCNESRNCCVLQ